MKTIFTFLMVMCLLAIPVLLVILVINAIRKRPLKKYALGILGSFAGSILSAAFSDGGLSIAFGLLAIGFIIAFLGLLIVLLVKAIRKKPLKKISLGLLGCFVGFTISLILGMSFDTQLNCEHEFSITENINATCSEEGKIVRLCSKCEKKEEEILPILEHKWQEANCESPKTCQLCNLTEGEKGEHKWEDATCIAPKTCLICNSSEGEALSADKTHSWQEATCTSPITCTVCGETDGDALGHTEGEWQITDEGTCEKQGTKQQMCSVCNTAINTIQFDSSAKIAADIVKDVVKNHSGRVSNMESVAAGDDTYLTVICAIACENSEQAVEDILFDIAEKMQELDFEVEGMFSFGDVEEGSDGECLAIASIDVDGNYTIKSMSSNFKTARNEWINSQFSAWDGSHTVLKELIKDNLNDEKSFDHIETTYIDIETEAKKNEVNNILKQAGYSQRVDIGDLFVMTKFSAKNAFNATIKNTAYGIVDYSADLVTLIGVE